MKIAQIAPLAESVPPRLYGGTERVVSYLTEELVRLGHDVTLFASGDSVTRARLVACAPRALRLDASVADPLPHLALMLERVRQRAHEFDVLHFHTEGLHFPLFRSLARKTITTVHGRLDLPESLELYRQFPDMPLASISDSQRAPLPWARWAGTVYHGLPPEVCPLNPAPPRGAARYLAFLGRVSPEKGLLRAIDIARRAGVRLRIAAKVDRGPDERFWREQVVPRLAPPLIEYVGEVDEAGKPGFLGNAAALLFPIDWPEPFGLAMIESMSCGTPVIAWRNGSVPEIVDEGVTGFIVGSIEQAVEATRRVDRLDRARVRARFDLRFSASRMAQDYLALYRRLGMLPARRPGPRPPGRPVLRAAT
ncbi:MAG: glycosyltransferase family 4 protein [Betaproteobacteria bacterium]|nr:glycosyltransferase family 4 protein [Betaproteobacteria bacterium]